MTREDPVILRFLSMTLCLGVSAIILSLSSVPSVNAQTTQQIVIAHRHKPISPYFCPVFPPPIQPVPRFKICLRKI